MLKIKDLSVSTEMKRGEMAAVVGGTSVVPATPSVPHLHGLLDGSLTQTSKVAAVQQAFGLELAQGNAGAVTNNQAIQGGNGISFAPVHQTQTQANNMDLSGIGNVSVF